MNTAERLLLSSVEKFHESNSLPEESTVLQNLRVIYSSLGRTAEITQINERLKNIHYQMTL